MSLLCLEFWSTFKKGYNTKQVKGIATLFIKLALCSCSTVLLATIFSQQTSKTKIFMKNYDIGLLMTEKR